MSRVSNVLTWLALVTFCASWGRPLAAQRADQRWQVDPVRSLVWWQINPHFGHLWATTCPEDGSWQAGEGRSSQAGGDELMHVRVTDYIDDRVPLFPRHAVEPVCRRAVSGSLLRNGASWRGARGAFDVMPDSLLNGSDLRDRFSRRRVFDTGRYPVMRFELDSLTNVRTADTLRADAHGVFELRGVRVPVVVPVTAWEEAGGLRVVGQTWFPARDLIDRFGMSKFALGLGVVAGRWKQVHWGVDFVLRPAGD